jgi:hypothetical protein
MKTAKSSKSRHTTAPLLGEVLTALKAEIEAAGQKLGFDVNQDDWIELLSAEADSYPLAIGGDEAESFVELMPKHIRARIKALHRSTTSRRSCSRTSRWKTRRGSAIKR